MQNQYSPAFLSSQPELDLCNELGVAFLSWSPLGGTKSAADLGTMFAPLQQVADAHGESPQVANLAWHLAASPQVNPIPGPSRPESIRDSVRAADLTLTAEELDTLAEAVKPKPVNA
ncbi:aldo/keto reductase [Marisediminicola antarctica]|uniref:aldo/keto reductase n=1 Tax=Marisediminicola antarctica TaxID=674079 RepID=UPI0030062B73